MNAIPAEWITMKRDVLRLKEYTGLPEEEGEDERKEGGSGLDDKEAGKSGHNTASAEDSNGDLEEEEDVLRC